MEAKNIDDVLVKSMRENLSGTAEHKYAVNVQEQAESKTDQEETQKNNQNFAENTQEQTLNSQNNENSVEERSAESKPDQTSSGSETIDEYGNPLPKPKTYTEDEVNRMMRERFNRSRIKDQNNIVSQQPPQPQVSPEDESWDIQLKKFVRNEYQEMAKEEQTRHWQAQEQIKQAEFESKFTQGMGKYSDFHDVIQGKNITDSMMLATRHLDNPAAFIYAAAKTQSQELDRISKINDPYIQASEVGRLHERMVKNRNMTTAASKPLENINSDLPPAKTDNKVSIDERIQQHARSKRR